MNEKAAMSNIFLSLPAYLPRPPDGCGGIKRCYYLHGLVIEKFIPPIEKSVIPLKYFLMSISMPDFILPFIQPYPNLGSSILGP